MQLTDAIHLLQAAPISSDIPAIWADLGSGSGLFTRALAHLLPEQSTIYAIDKSRQSLPGSTKKTSLHFLQADFEKSDLSLPPLQGILMANSLHYVANKKALLLRLQAYFADQAKFIIVEYDTQSSNPWVPYPIDFSHLKTLFMDAGFQQVIKLGERPSAYGRSNMYAAWVE